jgi:hypothetical protein
MRLPDGAKRHPRLQRAWTWRPEARLFASQANPSALRREERRGLEGIAAPLSEGFRQGQQPLDSRDGRRGELRGGARPKAGLGGDRPGYFGAPSRSALATSETLDHLPRSSVRKKKRRRDRLISVAAADPEWAVGFEDECWWSRVALPTLSSWAEEGKPLRLVQRSVAKDDPDPRRPSPATGCICPSSNRRGCVL